MRDDSHKQHGPVESIASFIEHVPETRRLLIGYSGGLDSHVLLHATIACLKIRPDLALRVLHVNHGLQPASDDWAEHCRAVCETLGVDIMVLPVDVDTAAGHGPEAAARKARYQAFATEMQESDYLLLGQHADDQAETFLLQALRGSGPDGLASIPRMRRFASGWLCRPMLGCNRGTLVDYASETGLHWIEDPSNQDNAFDRNFLRNEVIPLLKSRWPAVAQTLSRSASRSGAASRLLLSLASDDLGLVSTAMDNDSALLVANLRQLEIPLLRSLGQERMFNVIRLWIRQSGYKVPRLQDLRQINQDLVINNSAGGGCINLRGCEVRRYQDKLWLLPHLDPAEPFQYQWDPPFEPLVVPEAERELTREQCASMGLALPDDRPVMICSRQGGELIKIGQPEYHKSVKKLLQESQIPPWERERLPLLYIDGRLAAIWQVVVANRFRTENPEPTVNNCR